MDHVKAIQKLTRRVRWRHRLQLALRRVLVVGAAGLTLFALAVLLVKGRLLPTDAVPIAGLIAAAAAVAAALSGLLRRLDDVRLAAALDEAGGLHSRLGTALAFSREEHPSELMRAAIDDAGEAVRRARPAAAAPWRWAAFATGAALAVGALAVSVPSVFAVDFPVGRADAASLSGLGLLPSYAREKVELTKLDEEVLDALGDEVAEQERAAATEDVEKLLADLNELIRKLQRKEITPEQAFAQLASLEKAAEAWEEQHAKDRDEAEAKLREAAQKARRPGKELEPFFDAMKKEQLDGAAEALEATADKLDDKEGAKKGERLDKRDAAQVQKDLEQLAKALQTERQKEEERRKRDRDRLKKEEEADKTSDAKRKRDRDRLKQENQRELERLEKEQQELSQALRELERLQAGLDQAAQDLLRRLQEQAGKAGGQQEGQPSTAEQLRQAAELLRRMAKQGAGRQQVRVAQGKMGEMKEMLRRAGQGKQRKQGQDGGQGDGEGDEMGRFQKKAGGQEGEGQGESGQGGQMAMGKDGKGGDMQLLGPQSGQGPRIPLPGKGQGQGDGAEQGDGQGEGHDPRLEGRKSEFGAQGLKEDLITGVQGDGPSQSKVIFAAASKGFASAAYRDVHQDYEGVVEDALDAEKIPPGKRAYVRRYFDLIRPR